uniref:Uncharacterized protein n=1 Tax=Bionectria ochroleuca TaxID=29856 RepID=A0A8H7TR60_BIOOC
MRRDSYFLALGTVTLRMPSLRLAVTPSCSTRVGKLKVRANSPMLRSVSQYLALSAAVAGFSAAASPAGDSVFLATSDSSSTVTLWALSCFSSPPSVMAEAEDVPQEAGGRGACGVGALDFSADLHGLGVGELDVDVVLAQACELAVELVVVGRLADVELGLPGLEAQAAGV